MSYLEREARAQREAGVSTQQIAKNLNVSETRAETAIAGEYVVRIVDLLETNELLCFVQCLSYGGLIQLHHRSDGERAFCFDVLPPAKANSQIWAGNLAKYMAINGFNAVAAPRWSNE